MFAFARNTKGAVHAVEVLDFEKKLVKTSFDNTFRMTKRKRQWKATEISPFGDDAPQIGKVKVIKVDGRLVSIGYIDRDGQSPIQNLPVKGTGLIGMVGTSPIPGQVEFDAGNVLYLKDELARQWFENVSHQTIEYVAKLAQGSNTKDQLELITHGWNVLLRSVGSDQSISLAAMKEFLDEWVEMYFDPSIDIAETWKHFNTFPKHILPSPVSVILVFSQFTTIVTYANQAMILPPYREEISYLVV